MSSHAFPPRPRAAGGSGSSNTGPPGGESWADLALRLRSFLADLNDWEPGRRVLVVAHDAVILLFRYVCEAMSEGELLEIAVSNTVTTASATQLVRPSGTGRWTAQAFNMADHLRELGAPVTIHSGDAMSSRTDPMHDAATASVDGAPSGKPTAGPILVTPALLRDWRLPAPGASKYSRGQALIIGGARQTPGAVMLAGVTALRVGAGRLTMAAARSVAGVMAVAVPESGVIGLPENESGSVLGGAGDQLRASVERADAVLIGSGLDDPEQTGLLLRQVLPLIGEETHVVLDAFALGVLPGLGGADGIEALNGRLVLTPNDEEAARLLDDSDRGSGDQGGGDNGSADRTGGGDNGSADRTGGGDQNDAKNQVALAIARKFGAVVSCRGRIAAPDGQQWQISTGYEGLGTSGSGDVLAGAVVGLLARGASPSQAACWATHAHAAAGDRLAAKVGALGYLAPELVDELPAVLTELGT